MLAGAAYPSKPIVVTPDFERLKNFVSLGCRIMVIFLRHLMKQISFVVCLGSAGCISDCFWRLRKLLGF